MEYRLVVTLAALLSGGGAAGAAPGEDVAARIAKLRCQDVSEAAISGWNPASSGTALLGIPTPEWTDGAFDGLRARIRECGAIVQRGLAKDLEGKPAEYQGLADRLKQAEEKVKAAKAQVERAEAELVRDRELARRSVTEGEQHQRAMQAKLTADIEARDRLEASLRRQQVAARDAAKIREEEARLAAQRAMEARAAEARAAAERTAALRAAEARKRDEEEEARRRDAAMPPAARAAMLARKRLESELANLEKLSAAPSSAP